MARIATLNEVRTLWSVDDVLDVHELLDLMEG
jgi:hypothetical protein